VFVWLLQLVNLAKAMAACACRPRTDASGRFHIARDQLQEVLKDSDAGRYERTMVDGGHEAATDLSPTAASSSVYKDQ
jgi:hypothetical protein